MSMLIKGVFIRLRMFIISDIRARSIGAMPYAEPKSRQLAERPT